MKEKLKHSKRSKASETVSDDTLGLSAELTAEEEIIIASAAPEAEIRPELQEHSVNEPSDKEVSVQVSAMSDDSGTTEQKSSENLDTEDEKPENEAKPETKPVKKREKVEKTPKKNPAVSLPKFTKTGAIPVSDNPATGRLCQIPDLMTSSPSAIVYIRVIAAVIAIVLPRLIDIPDAAIEYFNVGAALIAGYDIFIAAIKDILAKVYLRENLPLCIAVLCAFAIGDSTKGAIAVILLQVAYILRSLIVKKTKYSALEGITPPTPEKGVSVGDTIVLTEGVHVPVDCSVTEGRGMVDCSFITGDLAPVQFKGGDFIPAGCVCLSGQMMLRAEALPEAGICSKIARSADSGYKAVSPTEEKLTAYARFVTPVMLLVSLIMLIILPFSYDYPFTEALGRVITIIAISSPCSALLAVPMTYLEGIIAARHSGIVFRDSVLMDKTADVKTVVFDKVGTVTNDSYVVSDLYSDRMEPGVFLKVAAHAAAVSSSSVCKAIVAAYGDYINFELVKDFIEYRGKGVSVIVDGIQILLGNHAFISENHVSIPADTYDGTTVYMAVQGVFAGRIVLKDSINSAIPEANTALMSAGVDRIAMISSDSRERDGSVARESGINEYYAECTSDDKARRIKDIRNRTPAGSALAYVGCGDYCEQACRTADVGIILRGMENRYCGSDADVVVMGRAVGCVPEAISRANRTRITAKVKFFAILAIKLIIVILAITGTVSLWLGLLLDNAFALALIPDYTGFLRPKTDFSADN